MPLNRLTSTRNLTLAWRRITTGRNIQYKRFFRPLYQAYESGHEENLARLSRRLGGSWHPDPPTRVYLPKPSGLQRPITLLGIEDQIVLQAVANLFADQLRRRRSRVERTVVFSNILNDPGQPDFFVQDWRQTYADFRTQCAHYYYGGFRWIATFDLAAFYDTVSHELLIHSVSPRQGARELWDIVRGWLKRWSSVSYQKPYEHGLPQGPIASDFLAECFLLPLDEALLRAGIFYVRYVDDIRLFGVSLPSVQKAAVALEILARDLGLIPQGGKFRILEAKSLEEAIGDMPSIIPPDQTEAEELPTLTRPEAEAAIRDAVSNRPQKITDKTKARYVLYRAPPSPRILDLTLRLLPRHPEHVDAFCSYLRLYRNRPRIDRRIEQLLRDGSPYDYVQGELWLLLADMATTASLPALVALARDDFRRARHSWHLQYGTAKFLLRCHRDGVGRHLRTFLSLPPMTKALLVADLPVSAFRTNGTAASLLRDDSCLPGLALGPVLLDRRLTHTDLGVQVQEMDPLVQNVFRGLELVRRRRAPAVDPIGDILASRYDIDGAWRFRQLLGREYRHCLQLLREADNLYDVGPSQWLARQDAFNDAVIRAVLRALQSAGLPGGRSVIDRHGELVVYGVLLDSHAAFAQHHRAVADPFRTAHSRRNALPDAHPYDKKTGQRNRYLSVRERATMTSALGRGFAALRQIIAGLP